MTLATAIHRWRQYPTEIEKDLLAIGLDILDWHRGTRNEHGILKLSSRRLLVLIDHPDDDSALVKSMTDGWPETTKILAEIHREIALYRASKYVKTKHEYQPMTFLSPIERVERHTQAREMAEFSGEARDELLEQAFGGV